MRSCRVSQSTCVTSRAINYTPNSFIAIVREQPQTSSSSSSSSCIPSHTHAHAFPPQTRVFVRHRGSGLTCFTMTKVKRERTDDGYDDDSLAPVSKKFKKEKSLEGSVSVKQEHEDSVCLGDSGGHEMSYEEKLAFVNAISQPMAPKKLCKKLFKLLKKAGKHKHYVVSGLKSVQSAIRKGQTGLVLLAGDVTPIDIISYLPGVCEEKGIPYVYTPSRKDLGIAIGTRRCILVLLIKEHEDYKPLMDECVEQVKRLDIMV